MYEAFQKAKDGKFSISALTEAPIVKKAFDLYQGGDNVWKVYADDFYQDALKVILQRWQPEEKFDEFF